MDPSKFGQKLRENFVRIKQNVQIIHTSKSMETIGKHTIVQITIVWIIHDVRISEGQIIRAILYMIERWMDTVPMCNQLYDIYSNIWSISCWLKIYLQFEQ